MFRLITFFASTLCLAAFVWFGLTVDLGEHTLFGHLKAIFGTPEAEKLVEGARSKVTDLVGIEAARHAERERAKAAADRDPPGTAPAGPPQEDLGADDRAGLRRMIEDKKSAGKAAPKTGPAGGPPARPIATKPPGNRPGGSAGAATPPKQPPVKGRVPPPTPRPASTP